jgi:hypothetical protein
VTIPLPHKTQKNRVSFLKFTRQLKEEESATIFFLYLLTRASLQVSHGLGGLNVEDYFFKPKCGLTPIE